MEIEFQNDRQVKIAELMWNAENQDAVNLILKTFGHDAQVVYHMILAETYDQHVDTDIAKQVLNNFSLKE